MTEEEQGTPEAEEPTPALVDEKRVKHTGIVKKYEFVMAAAREAERLNDYYRNHGIQSDTKVTTEAIDRVRLGLSKVVYEEPKPAEEETRRESTYIFGP